MHHLVAELKAARKANGLTMEQLAQQAGTDRMTVQRVESGTTDPRLSTLSDLLRALGLELMVVPAALSQDVGQFVQAQGRILGQPSGVGAPASIVDVLTQTASRRAP